MGRGEWTGKWVCGFTQQEMPRIKELYFGTPYWDHDKEYLEARTFNSCEECAKYADENIQNPKAREEYKKYCYKEAEKTETFLEKLAIVIAVIFTAITVIAALIALFPLIVEAIATIIPGLVSAVKGLVTFVYETVKGFISVFKPIIQGLKNLYDNWVKPTLTWVENKVTQLTDSIFKVYDLTVGGIVDTYDNLFGWVGGVQARLNDLFDKTASIVAIFDQKLADKIKKAQNDMNDFVYKYTAEWFDKILLKIQEYTDPILKAVGEVRAVFLEKIDFLTGIAQRADTYATNLQQYTYEEGTGTELDVYDATKEEPEEVESPEEAYEEPEKPPPKPPTPFERAISRFVGGNLDFVSNVLEETEETIEETINDTVEEIFAVRAYLDTNIFYEEKSDITDPMLLWWIGEINFWEYVILLLKNTFKVRLPARSRERELENLEEDIEDLRKEGYTEDYINWHREVWTDAINAKWDRKEKRKARR